MADKPRCVDCGDEEVGLEMVCPCCFDEDEDTGMAVMNAVSYEGAVFFVCVKHREAPLCFASADDLIFWEDGEPAKGKPIEENMPSKPRILH